MKILLTIEDIEELAQNGTYDIAFINFLKREFENLQKHLYSGKLQKDFSLQCYSPMLLLEDGDGIKDLTETSMDKECRRLLNVIPEFAERLNVSGLKVYKVVFFNTDHTPTFTYVLHKHLNAETRFWLSCFLTE